MRNRTTVGVAMVFGFLLSGLSGPLHAADQPRQAGQVPAAGIEGGKGRME